MNNQTEDMASETAIADMSGRPSAGGHCDSMVEYLREAHRMVSRLLQEADFNDVFPFVFGHPSVVGDAVVVQNELALLLYKAQMHLTAVVRASRGGNSGLPSRVRISDRVAHLPGGVDWHRFLSERFCGGRATPLSEPSMFGGVVSSNTEADRLAVAFLLDYLTQQTILMIFSYGFVLIGVNGDPQPCEDASELLDRMNADAAGFRAWLAQQQY